MGVLYDYLPSVTPDYNAFFPIDSYDNALVVSGDKAVEVHSSYSTSEERVLFSGQTKFIINLQFSLFSEIDEELLFNFYNNEDKACATYRSFKFQPVSQYSSESGHVYVVRFGMPLETVFMSVKRYGTGNIQLVVLGKVLD